MIQELLAEARTVGLELRLSKCKWAQGKRPDQSDVGPQPEHAELAAMARVPETACMRVLGAPVHMQADSTVEFDEVVARVKRIPRECAVVAIPRPSTRQTAGAAPWHISLLRMGKWNQSLVRQLQKLKAVQVRMLRRLARWFPSEDRDSADFLKCCSAWAQTHFAMLCMP